MKLKLAILPTLVCGLLAVAAWRVYAKAEMAFPGSESSETASRDMDIKVAQMDRDIKEVLRRVKVSAPMELETGLDSITEAVQNGFVIDVTLEEVEAALAAASATTDEEDDKWALELRHRGSYRFFSPSAAAPFAMGDSKQ